MRGVVLTLWLIVPSGCTLRSTDYLQVASGCVAPQADCDGDGSCETNLANDPGNCGACDETCDGIACEEGSCLLDTLAEGMLAFQIAVDDAHAYLTSDRVVFIPLHGGGSWDNFHVQLVPPVHLWGIYVDDGHVWWVGQALDAMDQVVTALLRKPRGMPGAAEEVMWLGDNVGSTAYQGTITGSAATIAWSYGLAGPTAVLGAFKSALPEHRAIATGEAGVGGISTNAQFDVLWVTGLGDLTRWPAPAGTIDLTSGLARPIDVVLADLTEAYYLELGPAEMPPVPNGQLGRIRWTNPPDGAVPAEPLVTDLAEPVALLVDNTHVYLSESSIDSAVEGTVKRVDRSTLAVETLARARSPKDIVGDLDMHGDTLAWVVVLSGRVPVVQVWTRSKKAYALPP